MASQKKLDAQEELIRLVALQLRRTAKRQSELIVDLDRVGFGQTRIAELVGTTRNAVNVTLNKAKKTKGK